MREKSEVRHPYPRYTDESVPFPILFKEYLLLTKLLMKMEVSNIVIMVIPPIQSTFAVEKSIEKCRKFKCISEIFLMQYQCYLEFSLKNSVFRRNRKSYRYYTFKNRA